MSEWVENKKCTKCGSENIKWHLSSTKECKDCNHVFRAEDLKVKENKIGNTL